MVFLVEETEITATHLLKLKQHMHNRTPLSDATQQKRLELIFNYERACNAYLRAFCARHEFELEPRPWVGNSVGGIAEISDRYVDMETIRVDVDSLCSVDEFDKWYDYSVRAGTLGVTTPNFDSWLRKCPVRTEKELAEMEATRWKIAELEELLRGMAAGASAQLLPPKNDIVTLKNLSNPTNPE